MATLGVSAGFTCQNNFGRKSDYSREIYAKSSLYGAQVFCPSKLCNRRKVVTKSNGVKANYDHIPKQFREENLKDGVMENFKNVPEELYGLPSKQLEKLMVGDTFVKRQAEQATAESLSSSSYYNSYNGLLSKKYSKNPEVSMRAGTTLASGGFRKPRSPPPDLPSLLLDNRIIYLNVPLYAEITELVLAQLIWLDFDNPEKPVFLYIDSTGTQNEEGEAVSLEYDAYAIGDMLNNLKCKIYTLNLATAMGQAGMLLSLGTKGFRYTQPGAVVQLHLPKAIPEGGQSTDMWIRAKELVNETDTFLKFLAQGTGKSKEELANDLVKRKIFNAEEAIEYGIVDKIMQSEKVLLDAKRYDTVSYEEKIKRMKARQEKRRTDRRADPAMSR
ncbi:hypothetical protein SUGI_0995780 [Cryptomeria japonica]|uniref:ATP-dependent Clp protease proteolytic subunit-related protein 1, chloroplastic n=1 Tax=Cryptomeria japonica TaxID=3369 RepID=UPI0024146F2D|nr:ATP-dependent Clp protease proteolytic subunit-related protein 1, chloroplastic [Cryptomeria japonica]GLJ47168.1 hypothetical protein SUGI_0995780 [Cryptomeria japonica]